MSKLKPKLSNEITINVRTDDNKVEDNLEMLNQKMAIWRVIANKIDELE